MSLGSKLKKMANEFNKEHKAKEKYVPLNVKFVSNIEDIMNFIETNTYFMECAKRGHYKYKMECRNDNREIWNTWKEVGKNALTYKDVTFQYVKPINKKTKHYLVFSWN